MKLHKTLFINQMEEDVQADIKKDIYYYLQNTLELKGEELWESYDNACNSRLIDVYDSMELDTIRICSECGDVMQEGYCIEDGDSYHCDKKCLNKRYTDEEFEELYDNGDGNSYYTEWY